MTKQSPTYFTYVLRCADDTLYCGYSTDVDARVATHNAGRGAKYTQSRLPVRLVAYATFASRHAALSAEWHFKQLSRAEKERMLEAVTDKTTFEALLSEAFGIDARQTDIAHDIESSLQSLCDKKYAQFMAPLMPTVSPDRIIGVRTPALKKLAKTLAKRDDVELFLNELPHRTFEESQLHAFVLNGLKDYDALVEALEAFLPYVDNWATCDQMRPATLAKQPERTAAIAQSWMERGQREGMTYMTRFGIGVLMRWFLDKHYDPAFMEAVVNVNPGEYYIDMMRAWYIAEALVKQPTDARDVLERGTLDIWTHNKAIQKARESRRVSPEMKNELAALRR